MLHAVRELSKWMNDGATVDRMKLLLQAINYVMHVKRRGLMLTPKMIIDDPRSQSFVMKGRSCSNYTTNPETK